MRCNIFIFRSALISKNFRYPGNPLVQHSFENSNLLKTTFMIIVHDIFICKPGNASKVETVQSNDRKWKISQYFDRYDSQYNRVVMVTKYDSLSAFEASWKSLNKIQTRWKRWKKMAGYIEMYLTGSRDFWVWWGDEQLGNFIWRSIWMHVLSFVVMLSLLSLSLSWNKSNQRTKGEKIMLTFSLLMHKSQNYRLEYTWY
jgi:hypothetical protein